MKHELLQTRRQLALARRGHDVLEQKRRLLQGLLHKKKQHAQICGREMAAAVHHAWHTLEEAYADAGCHAVEKKRVMETPYPLAGTTASMDAAYFAWLAAKEKLLLYYDAENDVFITALAHDKTKKRAAALGHVIIPKYEARIRYIQAQLEESERDALARLKRAKSLQMDASQKLCSV